MKNKLLAALLVTAAAAPFAAQAQNTYIGASVGRAELKADANGLSDKETTTGYKAYAGYQFNPTFGIEVGYADLGKLSRTDGTNSFSINPTSFYAAATATMPVAEHFSLFAKAGVSANRTKASITTGSGTASDSSNNTTAILGVGAAYALTKSVSLTLEYENFGKVFDENNITLKTSMLSFGARYQF